MRPSDVVWALTVTIPHIRSEWQKRNLCQCEV